MHALDGNSHDSGIDSKAGVCPQSKQLPPLAEHLVTYSHSPEGLMFIILMHLF
jgi:hypothetical protein